MSLSTDHSKAVLVSDDAAFGKGTGASRADRPTSFDPADFSKPTGQEEEWRFTPMDRIEAFFEPLDAVPAAVTATQGNFSTVTRDDSRVGRVGKPEDLTGARAWEAAKEATLVEVTGDGEETILSIVADGSMNVAHVVVDAAAGAKGTVVLEHSGSGSLAETVEVVAGDESELTVVSVQEGERTARHVAHERIRVGRGAKVRHIVVTVGGDMIRMCTSAEYAGEGGDLELLGAYITESEEHHEHRLFVDHDPANCVSRATYKGALQGDDAHAVWIGDVLIRSTAKNTDTYELNRNLVLTKGGKADSVPNLEIETGEIAGAGHASATGRFDEEQLFYLRARGIPEDIARRLVVRGFFAELVENIGVESVQEKLMAAIERELDLAEARRDA